MRGESFLVHQVSIAGPATHAIVIGVGAYPHIDPNVRPAPGEHRSLAVIRRTLRPLDTPPRSAAMIADWLITGYASPDKPLASVSLLVSDPITFQNPLTGVRKMVQPAGMANVREAVKAWKARGDENEDHRLLFSFSGHGLAQETEHALLLSSFGGDTDNPFNDALDFPRFRLGMARCRARQQCFFVDSCRSATEILDDIDIDGDPIIAPERRNNPDLPLRLAPVFFSTLEGAAAYGPSDPNKPSYFTDALLEGLKSSGAQQLDGTGQWSVTTNSLKLALDDHMRERFADGLPQLPGTHDGSDFELNRLSTEPVARVAVSCSTADAHRHATLYCDGVSPSPPIDPRPWELSLLPGTYR